MPSNVKFNSEEEIIAILASKGIEHTGSYLDQDGGGKDCRRIQLANGVHVILHHSGHISGGGKKWDEVQHILETGWRASQAEVRVVRSPATTEGFHLVATLVCDSLAAIAEQARTTGQDVPLATITLVRNKAEASVGPRQQPGPHTKFKRFRKSRAWKH